MISLTQHDALERIRGLPMTATKYLVEQGTSMAVAAGGDIDFWAAGSDRDRVCDEMASLGAINVVKARHLRWANHDVYILNCTDGWLQVDVKFGDLRVGPLTIMFEAELLASVDAGNRFSGMARIADVLIRRLARGKSLDDDRLEDARLAWRSLGTDQRESVACDLIRRFGDEAAEGIGDLLEGREPAQPVARLLRMQVFGAYLGGPGAMWLALFKSYASITGWLTRRLRPFGQYPQGVIVTISGTDGTGKSTTLENVEAAVRAAGLRCHSLYLGRGRGNLKPVAFLRAIVSRRVQNKHDTPDVYRSPAANRGASWLYAFEYLVRTLKVRILGRVFGYVVICDRYCYDIALIPGASPAAVRTARWLCPRPEMNVVLHAPADVILQRKKERGRDELEKQQATLMQVVAKGFARFESLSIDTSETGVDDTCDSIVRKVLRLSHRRYL